MKNVAPITLANWAGYRAGTKYEASDGTVEIMFHGDRVTASQRRAHASIRKLADALQPVLLDAIVEAYPRLRARLPRPATVTRASLRKLVQLFEATVAKDDHDGTAYVAYVFSCAWDPSGVYVLTHGDRVVAVGQSEVLGYPIADPARSAPKDKPPSDAQRTAAVEAATKAARKNPRELSFELDVVLPAWAGFRSRPGGKLSRGKVHVEVGGDAVLEEDVQLTDGQRAAFRHVVDGAAATQKVLLKAIAAKHPKEKPLRDRVELLTIHIHGVERAGLAYVGYQLDCGWDAEHALGVLTHGKRVVEVGSADTAFLSWIAERDRKRR